MVKIFLVLHHYVAKASLADSAFWTEDALNSAELGDDSENVFFRRGCREARGEDLSVLHVSRGKRGVGTSHAPAHSDALTSDDVHLTGERLNHARGSAEVNEGEPFPLASFVKRKIHFMNRTELLKVLTHVLCRSREREATDEQECIVLLIGVVLANIHFF